MEWVGDAIGILLVIFLARFFVDGMLPDPPTSNTTKKPNDPIEPSWR